MICKVIAVSSLGLSLLFSGSVSAQISQNQVSPNDLEAELTRIQGYQKPVPLDQGNPINKPSPDERQRRQESREDELAKRQRDSARSRAFSGLPEVDLEFLLNPEQLQGLIRRLEHDGTSRKSGDGSFSNQNDNLSLPDLDTERNRDFFESGPGGLAQLAELIKQIRYDGGSYSKNSPYKSIDLRLLNDFVFWLSAEFNISPNDSNLQRIDPEAKVNLATSVARFDNWGSTIVDDLESWKRDYKAALIDLSNGQIPNEYGAKILRIVYAFNVISKKPRQFSDLMRTSLANLVAARLRIAKSESLINKLRALNNEDPGKLVDLTQKLIGVLHNGRSHPWMNSKNSAEALEYLISVTTGTVAVERAWERFWAHRDSSQPMKGADLINKLVFDVTPETQATPTLRNFKESSKNKAANSDKSSPASAQKCNSLLGG